MTVELHYREYAGAGEPLLILHGLFGNLKNWHTHARQLQARFRVISVDLRNHGESPHVDSMSYPEMAADVIALLDRLELGTARLLGHSMGGKVAMELALHHAERVSALLVADIAPIAYSLTRGDHENVFAGLLAVEPEQLKSRSEADAVLAEHIDEPGVRQFLLGNLTPLEQGGYRWRFNLEVLNADYRNLREAVQGEPYEGPALFVKGAESNYIQDVDWPEIRRLFPAAKLRIIADTGHWLHAERPQIFSRICEDFFSAEGIAEGMKK